MVIRKLARYKVRRDHVRDVEQIVRKFVEAVHEAEPDTEYQAYRGEDELTFIHLMGFPDEEAEHRHQQARYTARFIEALLPNCEVRPSFIELNPIE